MNEMKWFDCTPLPKMGPFKTSTLYFQLEDSEGRDWACWLYKDQDRYVWMVSWEPNGSRIFGYYNHPDEAIPAIEEWVAEMTGKVL